MIKGKSKGAGTIKKNKKDKAFKEGNLGDLFESFIGPAASKKALFDKVNDDISNLPAGPLPKNTYTIQFEEIITKLLANETAVFSEKAGKYSVTIEGEKYDLSDILEKFDSRQISFADNNACKAYSAFLTKAKVQPAKPAHEGGGVPEQKWYDDRRKGSLVDLRTAEMAAINIYTGAYHEQMNAMLRGVPHNDFKASNTHFQRNMKEVLLHIAMAESGLNKMPDTTLDSSFRYEDDKLPQSIIDQRIASVNSNPDNPIVTFERGFVSAAKEKPSDTFEGRYRTAFVHLSCKDVSGISAYPSERECLMNQTQMKWVYHNQYGDHHYFLAAPVNTLQGLSASQQMMPTIINPSVEQENQIAGEFFIDLLSKLEEYEKYINKKIELCGDHPGPYELKQLQRYNRLMETIGVAVTNKAMTFKQKFDQVSLVILQLRKELTLEEKTYGHKSQLSIFIDAALANYNNKMKAIKAKGTSSVGNYLQTEEVTSAIEYVYNQFLSKPYDENLKKYDASDWSLMTTDGRVERPNHGLAHTLRVAAMVPVIAELLKANNPKFATLSNDDIKKAQYLMLFSVIGRGNEIGFFDADKLYNEYKTPEHLYSKFKEIAKKGFSDWVDDNKPALFNNEELDVWKECLDTGKPNNSSLVGQLMAIAHDMDLMRCYTPGNNPGEFGPKIEQLKAKLNNNEAAVKQLTDYARDLLAATGDRCMGYGKGFSYNKNVFGKCSHDYRECLKNIAAVPVPTMGAVATVKATTPTAKPVVPTHIMPVAAAKPTAVKPAAAKKPPHAKPATPPKGDDFFVTPLNAPKTPKGPMTPLFAAKIKPAAVKPAAVKPAAVKPAAAKPAAAKPTQQPAMVPVPPSNHGIVAGEQPAKPMPFPTNKFVMPVFGKDPAIIPMPKGKPKPGAKLN